MSAANTKIENGGKLIKAIHTASRYLTYAGAATGVVAMSLSLAFNLTGNAQLVQPFVLTAAVAFNAGALGAFASRVSQGPRHPPPQL